MNNQIYNYNWISTDDFRWQLICFLANHEFPVHQWTGIQKHKETWQTVFPFAL